MTIGNFCVSLQRNTGVLDNPLKQNKKMISNNLFNNSREKDAAIIYSGGLDSTTLLYEKREHIALAVTFDYGSNHAQQEIACAKWHCEHLGIDHAIVNLSFFKEYFTSSLISGADTIPNGSYDEKNMKSTVVPFRNGIMLSIACGMAESRELTRVLIANHGGDHAIYPDCRPEFIAAMDAAMQAGTYIGVRIEAPYTNLTKADLVRKGTEMGIDYGHTYSCYRGGERHCGLCGTCTERREAFRECGIKDPTIYEQ